MAAVKSLKQKFGQSLAEARKDPTFHRDIRKFIKITTGVYRLKDYGMDT